MTAPLGERIKLGSEVTQSLVSLLRDISIIVLLLVFVFNVDVLKQWMQTNNIETVGILGIEVKAKKAVEDSATALEQMVSVQESTAKAIAALSELRDQQPQLRPQLDDVLGNLRQAGALAVSANETISSAAITQQELLAAAQPNAPVTEGWVSLNFLTADGSVEVGQNANVIPPRPLNMRSGPGSDYEILGRLFPGAKVQVLEGPQGNWVRVSYEPDS